MTEVIPTPVPPVLVMDIKAFLALPKVQRPKVLLEKETTLKLDGIDLSLTVRQLTKRLYEDMTARINTLAPHVPTVEQPYSTAHRDPSNPQKIRPAGTYKEPNDKDPNYLREVQEWFTQGCIWLAVYSAVDSLGVDIEDPAAVGMKQEELANTIPGPELLKLALDAASVNPGLSLADELIRQQAQSAQMAEAEAQLARLTADLETQYAENDAAPAATSEEPTPIPPTAAPLVIELDIPVPGEPDVQAGDGITN